MPSSHFVPDWRKALIAALASALLVLAALFILHPAPAAHAQGQIQLEIDKQLQGSNLIRVGQEMTFTIRIRNTGSLTVTKLPLIDNYNGSILQLRRSDPAFSTHDQAQGAITWADLTSPSLFGPLGPSGEIVVTTVFRAIKAAPETVNFAKIGAAEAASGETGGGEQDSDKGGAEGGRVIVTKSLAPGQTATVGQPVSFVISLRNDGAADIVKLPLEDLFNPEYLAFSAARPAPDSIAPDRIAWNDVLPLIGRTRLRPNEVVTVTTVFTALKAFDGAGINRAAANGVQDEFQNAVAAPRQADVPVRIIDDQAATTVPTVAATPTPRRSRTPSATATPELTMTPEATATPELAATTAPTATLDTQPTPAATSTISAALPISGTGSGPKPTALPTTSGTLFPWPLSVFGGALLLIGAALLRRRAS